MLTERQQAILNFIDEYVELNSFPPSVREIGKHFGIFPATVQDHIAALEKKGCLTKKKFQSRSISIAASSRRTMPSETNRTRQAGNPGIPIVGRVAAGLPLLAQENIEDIIHLPDGWAPPGAFLLKVQGDSMEGAHILHGDYVLVHPQQTASNGEIVVALIEDEATVKRFYRNEKGIKLKPENSKFSPIEIERGKSASFRLVGRVAGVLRLTK